MTTGGSTTATYAYDGDGYRVSKTVGIITTPYTWDRLGLGGLGQLVADGQGETLFGPAGLQERISTAGAAQYAHGDGLGSASLRLVGKQPTEHFSARVAASPSPPGPIE